MTSSGRGRGGGGGGLFDRGDEPIDRPVAGVEVFGVEQQHVPAVGFGDDHRRTTIGSSADYVGLVVAVKDVERERQPGLAGFPLGFGTDRSVGDLAQ